MSMRDDYDTGNDADKDPRQIEAEIEQTRAHMSETLDAIQNKLSPGQMVDEVLGYFRGSRTSSSSSSYSSSSSGTGGAVSNFMSSDFAASLGNAVRSNPVPAALVGVGLVWLMLSGMSGSSGVARGMSRAGRRYRGGYGEDYSAGGVPEGYYDATSEGDYDDSSLYESGSYGMGEDADGDTGPGLGARLSDAASSAAHRAGAAARAARHGASAVASRAGAAASRAGEVAGAARETVSRTAGQAAHMASHMGSNVGQFSRRQAAAVQEGFESLLEERPLVLGGIGLAVGAALGAALPTTRRENELMGETRDRLWERAEEVGSEVRSEVERAATRLKDTALEQVEREGINRDLGKDILSQAKEKVQNVASAVTDAARQEAERAGLTGSRNEGENR